jgi:hypothetical protein
VMGGAAMMIFAMVPFLKPASYGPAGRSHPAAHPMSRRRPRLAAHREPGAPQSLPHAPYSRLAITQRPLAFSLQSA